MREFIRQDPFVAILMGFLGLLLVATLIAVYMSVRQDNKLQAFITQHGCTLQSEQVTGNRVYCGKGCYRDELFKTYVCPNGEVVVTN